MYDIFHIRVWLDRLEGWIWNTVCYKYTLHSHFRVEQTKPRGKMKDKLCIASFHKRRSKMCLAAATMKDKH